MAVETVNEPKKTPKKNISALSKNNTEKNIEKVTMNKFKKITNQELLTEISRRMSQKEISEAEFIKLFFINWNNPK